MCRSPIACLPELLTSSHSTQYEITYMFHNMRRFLFLVSPVASCSASSDAPFDHHVAASTTLCPHLPATACTCRIQCSHDVRASCHLLHQQQLQPALLETRGGGGWSGRRLSGRMARRRTNSNNNLNAPAANQMQTSQTTDKPSGGSNNVTNS